MQLKTFFAFALLFTAAPLSAQTAAPPNNVLPSNLEKLLAARPLLNQTLSIQEAVTIALRESPIVRGATAEVEMAQARLDQARAERKPAVGLYGFLADGSIPNNIVAPQAVRPLVVRRLASGGYADAKLSVAYPLYTGDRLQALVRQASALQNASQAQVQTQQHEVALLTRTAYHETLARRALVTVWQERLTEDEEQLRIDRVRAEEGKIPPFYVQRSEAEVAASQQELTNATRDVALSLAQLKTVMGINPLSELTLDETLPTQPLLEFLQQLAPDVAPISIAPAADAVPSTPPLNAATATFELPQFLPALLRLAERKRPELQASESRVQAAQAGREAQRSAFRPQINLFATGDLSNERVTGDGSASGVTYGVVAALPLFDSGLRRARVREAEAGQLQQEQERERVALQVGQEVTNALLNARAAAQNIGTAQSALVAAREEYRVARIRYEAGKSIPVEVLDALSARTRAASNQVQALYDWNVTRDQLLRAVGVLDESDASVLPATAIDLFPKSMNR